MLEIGLGLAIGAPLGAYLAHISLARPLAHRLVTLAAVAVQAIPVFAIAPLLVLWLGYGLASKIAMTTLIVFFPVLSAARDGLGRTPQSLLSAAQVMARGSSKAQRRIVTQIRWPAALPSVFSGLKIAAATAPIAAVIGEWVGASEGLGYAMLRANSRAETDIVFAALILLIALGIALHALAELCARWAIPWAYTDQETD
jgi:putative hydroxymethylpyrimidine transport system permease protein